MKITELSDIDMLEEVAEIIGKAQRMSAFSGAGVSEESGIPTFRDPGGLWDKYDPDEIATAGGLISYINKHPHEVKTMIEGILTIMETSKPNEGHQALTELQDMGILKSVITQNIDNLHVEAGNSNVCEVHGNITRFKCLSCSGRFYIPKDQIIQRYKNMIEQHEVISIQDLFESLPICRCGSKARFDVVMFGEAVLDMDKAYREAKNCDVMLILGTSGVVYPAAYIPHEAKSAGATVIEINPHTSSFTHINDFLIKAKTGEALPKIMELVKKTVQ